MNELEDIEQLFKPRCEFKASETLMQEVMKKAHDEARPHRTRRMWPWLAAACMAGVVMTLLMPSKTEKAGEPLVAETGKGTIVANRAEPPDWRDNAREKEQGPAVAQAASVAAETKQPRPDADMEKQKAKEAERILKLIVEADMAFLQATIQCTLDIEETFSQDEEPEETECETNIVI